MSVLPLTDKCPPLFVNWRACIIEFTQNFVKEYLSSNVERHGTCASENNHYSDRGQSEFPTKRLIDKLWASFSIFLFDEALICWSHLDSWWYLENGCLWFVNIYLSALPTLVSVLYSWNTALPHVFLQQLFLINTLVKKSP